ncbi:EamA family transporter [Synechococcus sp. AH-551-C10]|nr:EamA family transporter [Synechococcus sp. AH-551-C10]MDB4659616.1 EamA family transporter [Synechococcus sp. AH-551-C10]
MFIGHQAALAAAMAWTTASALWRSLSQFGTAIELNGLKNGLALLLFLPFLFTLPWTDQIGAIVVLLLSGVIGIAAGDSFYLGGLRRLGTQRALTVEAIGPVLASMGGVLMMGDTVRPASWAGALLVSCAVVLVAQQSKASSATNGTAFGLLLCVLAVMCGLSGAFLSRHVLITSSLSPMQTAAIRLLGGWLGLLPLLRGRLCPKHLPKGVVAKVVLATLLGTNLGIVLQQIVFQILPVGQGITLMSTAPVMALFLHRLEGESLQWKGVVAGLLAVSGVGLSSL